MFGIAKINRIPIYLLVLLQFSAFKMFSQVDAQLGHWMVNTEHYFLAPLELKPISAGIFTRQQWTGIDGRPQTYGVLANYQISNNFTGLLHFVNDKAGNINFNRARLGLSYGLGRRNNLRFNLAAVFHQKNFNTTYRAIDGVQGDPLLSGQTLNSSNVNFDFSVLYRNDIIRSGFSILNIANNRIESFPDEEMLFSVFVSKPFVLRSLGVLRGDVSLLYKAETNAFANGVPEALLRIEVVDNLKLGIGYRVNESIPALIEYKTGLNGIPLVMAYSYEINNSEFSRLNYGSHEFSLRIDLQSLKSVNSDSELDKNLNRNRNVRFL